MKNMSLPVMAAIGVCAVILAVSIGYAMTYQGSSSSENINADANMVAYVDIIGPNGQPLDKALSVPAFEAGATKSIMGYRLEVSGTDVSVNPPVELTEGKIRIACLMSTSASWVFIEDMWVTFDSDDTEYHFGISTVDETRISGVPTDSITLSTGYNHTFEIHVAYSDADPSADPMGEELAKFSGSEFKFYFDQTDSMGGS